MTNRRWWALLTLIVVFTLARVATTHRVFAQTLDEGAHLLAGYDALTKRLFSTDRMHPPLPRMLFALPFLNEPEPTVEPRFHELLLRDDRYTQNLARMRMGNLPFLALGIVAVALWGRRLLSPKGGLLAAVLYASLPPVLAHGGLATTDMAAAATLAFALYALDVLLERRTGFSPSWGGLKPALRLGLAVALGMLSKYSFLVFFPACAVVLLALRRRFPWKELLVAAVVAGILTAIVMPPPEYAAGLLEVRRKNADPPMAFLFGEARTGGWWYYFPVALFFKTPIAFLLLALAGVRRDAAAIAAVILGIAMTSDINIGVRHILPIYAPLALMAASIRVRWLTIAMTAWLVVGSALAHPDYLPWFNAFAGKEPQRVLNDSNLDWGQDILRLVRVARDERIPSISISLTSFAPLERIGFPPYRELQALQPVQGWVAVSELNLALGRGVSPELRQWVDATFADRPYRRVGKSIRLYRFD
ncbi:MAG TPA: glycosyltransferase family 39 protein [Thermoanaerobaculia bacterium]|nr:glycosyltransferase family 39 protein [Thermoanaerobaculia bacterium]